MLLPYILNILKNSGDLQTLPTICWKLKQFECGAQVSEDEVPNIAKQCLDQGIKMGLIRENKTRKMYGLSHRWFTPETTAFQRNLHEVVQNMPQTLSSDAISKEHPEKRSEKEVPEEIQNISQAFVDERNEEQLETTESDDNYSENIQNSPQDDCGPGMMRRRSPAQIRAIAIYRRMRAEREQAAKEQASRSRRRSDGNRRSVSQSRRRARSTSGTRRGRKATRRSKHRSTPRSRSKSQSKRSSYTPVASRTPQRRS